MVTSQDVARYVGVSQPTVSRALRDDPKVSERTKARVREAARLLGYVPSATGRALSVGRSQRIGLLLTDIENAFYPHIVAPMYREALAAGYELLLVADVEDSLLVCDRIQANGLDGVVLATSGTDSPLPIRLRDRGIPFVYFNRTVPAVGSDSVTVDATEGYRQLARRLRELGHARIGAVLGPQNTSTGLHREVVLRSALSAEGLLLMDSCCHRGPFDVGSGYAGMQRILASSERPGTIVCGNDVVAVGVLNALQEAGLDVPGDVSVVGFDNLPMAEWALMSLTTVAFDLSDMARAAVTLLTERVEGAAGDGFRNLQFDTRLIERRSLGPART